MGTLLQSWPARILVYVFTIYTSMSQNDVAQPPFENCTLQ